MADAQTDTRCPICYGLWSPFPCPYDKANNKENSKQETGK